MSNWITTADAAKIAKKNHRSDVARDAKKYKKRHPHSKIIRWINTFGEISYDDPFGTGGCRIEVDKNWVINTYINKSNKEPNRTEPTIQPEVEDDFLGDIHTRKVKKLQLPPKGQSKYYLITAAQNNTKVNSEFFTNVLAVKKHFNAELLVSRLVYNKNQFNTSREKESSISENDNEPRYEPVLSAFLNDEYLQLANDLVYLGHSNRLITSGNPLSSSHHFGFDKSFIRPHTKRALEAFPVSYEQSTLNKKKIGYTTGVVTSMNYIQNEAGQKAEMYHFYGVTLVKVNDDGSSYVYQLSASKDDNFSICIFDLMFIGGKVLTNQTIEALVLGDTHNSKLKDTQIFDDFFGENNMFKGLNFKNIILHDTLDFECQSHHTEKDYLLRYVQHHKGQNDVFVELKDTVDILNSIKKLGNKVYVVESNHDNHLGQYLNGKWKLDDHINKLTNLWANFIQYTQATVNNDIKNPLIENCIYKPFNDIVNDLKDFKGDIYEFFARKHIGLSDGVVFHNSTDDLIISDVSCGQHGDKGVNGARGGQSLRRLSRDTIIGHGHGSFVRDFLHSVGFTGDKKKFGYATTATTWTLSFATINSNKTITHYFYHSNNFR